MRKHKVNVTIFVRFDQVNYNLNYFLVPEVGDQ